MRIINSTAVNQNIIQCSLHKILNFSGKRYRIKNRKTFLNKRIVRTIFTGIVYFYIQKLHMLVYKNSSIVAYRLQMKMIIKAM